MTDDLLKNASWRCSAFNELSLWELHGIYAARQAVFVIEQECVYLDVDGMDPQAWHLAAWAVVEDGPLVADGAAQRPVGDFVGRGRHVPGVSGEHQGLG